MARVLSAKKRVMRKSVAPPAKALPTGAVKPRKKYSRTRRHIYA